MHSSPDEANKTACPLNKDNDKTKAGSHDKAGHGSAPNMMDIKSTHPEEVSGGIFSGENGNDCRTTSRRYTLFAVSSITFVQHMTATDQFNSK
ncbi:hypothetical protein AUP68_14253 [Ilyonectria robusta]